MSYHTVNSYLEYLVDAFLIRTLPPYYGNLRKRLVRSPKVYWRDTGLLHALINVHQPTDLLGHPMAGASFEALVIHHVGAMLDRFPSGPAQMYFYRTAAGAELDVLIETGSERIGVEVKFSETPKPTKGFWNACQDLQVNRAYVVAPAKDAYPLNEKTWVVPVTDVAQHLLNRKY